VNVTCKCIDNEGRVDRCMQKALSDEVVLRPLAVVRPLLMTQITNHGLWARWLPAWPSLFASPAYFYRSTSVLNAAVAARFADMTCKC